MNYYNVLAVLLIIITVVLIVNQLNNNNNDKNKEGFYNMAEEFEQTEEEQSQNNGSEEEEELPACKPTNWWENMPVKAIRSKLWGASYNLIYQEDGNINSPVLVPIKNPDNTVPQGCLTVTENGWHETTMCSTQNISQRWLVKAINNQQDFEKAMEEAKNNGDSTGFTYGYKMDKVDYPFFIVVSQDKPSLSLYYNGSALGVRPLGNYDDQKWDILKGEVKDPITTHKYNFYSKLTPEMQTSKTRSDLDSSEIFGFQNVSQNPEALVAMLQKVLQPPNQNGAFGVSGPLKINIEMDEEIISKLNEEEQKPVEEANLPIEAFTNQANSSQYPKKPLNVDVDLDYKLANKVFKTFKDEGNNSSNGTKEVPRFEFDENGKLVEVGKDTIKVDPINNDSVIDKDGVVRCDTSKCHPNPDDWLPKPYPCRACVPKGEETW